MKIIPRPDPVPTCTFLLVDRGREHLCGKPAVGELDDIPAPLPRCAEHASWNLYAPVDPRASSPLADLASEAPMGFYGVDRNQPDEVIRYAEMTAAEHAAAMKDVQRFFLGMGKRIARAIKKLEA